MLVRVGLVLGACEGREGGFACERGGVGEGGRWG